LISVTIGRVQFGRWHFPNADKGRPDNPLNTRVEGKLGVYPQTQDYGSISFTDAFVAAPFLGNPTLTLDDFVEAAHTRRLFEMGDM
jgi:hypothetical protein